MRLLVVCLAVSACGRPTIEDRDIPCPDAGLCPPDFACGWDDWCYREGSAPANFTGDYDLMSVTGDDSCGFDGWMSGSTGMNIPLNVTQSEDTVLATVGGAPGFLLNYFGGTQQLSGSVQGSTVHLTYAATRTGMNMSGCVFRVGAQGDATLIEDQIEGELILTALDSTCPSQDGCGAQLTFNGLRAPTPR